MYSHYLEGKKIAMMSKCLWIAMYAYYNIAHYLQPFGRNSLPKMQRYAEDSRHIPTRVFHIFFSSGAEVLQPGRCKELTHYYRSIFLKLSDMFFCNPKRSLAKIIVDFKAFANRLGYRKASSSSAVRALPPGNCPQNFRKQKGLAIVL